MILLLSIFFFNSVLHLLFNHIVRVFPVPREGTIRDWLQINREFARLTEGGKKKKKKNNDKLRPTTEDYRSDHGYTTALETDEEGEAPSWYSRKFISATSPRTRIYLDVCLSCCIATASP
jgi:hypothetical protein